MKKPAYFYDDRSFRLNVLRTTRNNGQDTLQDLNYYYDAVGNIVGEADHVQQIFYFANQEVEPVCNYTYDPLSRLLTATGREMTALQMPTHEDFPNNIPCPNPGPNAMQNYTQNYSYDALGNMLQMSSQNQWTRDYIYDTATNRLLRHTQQLPNTYTYDPHGNMLTMPHLSNMSYDYQDQLISASNGTFTSYYNYDAEGNRSRKVVVKSNIREERYYIGGYEIYRKYTNDVLDFERKTINISDDEKVFVRIEQKTGENPVIRYQYDNHLGSACLELDENASIISYEEYHPFGTTSYRSGRSETEVSLKRYKYCGKERDEETGLYYYGMRYYAAWLCRFVSVDPQVTDIQVLSPYLAMLCNPIAFIDPDGEWPVYSVDGEYLGDDGRYEEGKDLAFTGTTKIDEQGNITGYENLSQFTDNHTQFQIISNIVKKEGATKEADEYLWIAHTANNAANKSGKSLYDKLMSGYSSVSKANKTTLSILDNSIIAKYARAAVINVMSDGEDPTGGATLWDGTDFLSWGLKSPNGTPQNKFEEYKSISIPKDIYNDFLDSQLKIYTSGKVRYKGTYYNIPADVFTDKDNWTNEGNFFYSTGQKQLYGLKATGAVGRSIFWKKEK